MIPGIGGASAALPLIGEAVKMGTEAVKTGTEVMKLGGELLKAMSKKDNEGDQKDKVAGEDTHRAHGPINIAVNNDNNNNNNNKIPN
ncbi:hypothetical protein LRS56_01775 [Pseudomonas poae]|nr:hypothetical protein LRS56_01775 [Pseudomonas poae]